MPALAAGARRESPGVFAERRRRLASDVGSGVIVLVGHDEESGRSGFTGFRQESNFYYLTGYDEPGAALVIAPSRGKAGYREILFLPNRDDAAARWSGPVRAPDEAGESAFQEALQESEFRPALRALLRDRKRLFAVRSRAASEVANRLLQRVEGIAQDRDIRDVGPELARMRSIKSPEEIALIEEAARATVSAHRAAWSAVSAGRSEQDLVAEFVGAAFRAGCRRLAFPPMAGCGPNATVLHYQRNDSVLRTGQLVLMDAGGEHSRYAADVARTVPVDGTYTSDQRRLYDLVLGALEAAIGRARPGATLGGTGPSSLLAVAERFMRDRAPRGMDTNLPHALGHHVGLDVHDPAPFRSPLKPGMVLAIEPGVYFPDRGIGIRIEDMIEITGDGCRRLTRELPVAPDEVEAALAAARPAGADSAESIRPAIA